MSDPDDPTRLRSERVQEPGAMSNGSAPTDPLLDETWPSGPVPPAPGVPAEEAERPEEP